VTRLQAEKLPAEVRRKLGLDSNHKGAVKGRADSVFRGCCQCGEIFDGMRGRANWQAHSDREGPGHRRFLCDISPRSVP